MKLLQALYAFYRVLRISVCLHTKMAISGKTSGFCPDCGYYVRLRWNLCRCRTCGARRKIQVALDGVISPKGRYCDQCGQHEYRLVQKERIHGYELAYATLTREIDYLDQCIDSGFKTPAKTRWHPFKENQWDVFEGVMLRSEDLF
jgi:Zn finger protein HypA/HybF involved in hydrogenase expression